LYEGILANDGEGLENNADKIIAVRKFWLVLIGLKGVLSKTSLMGKIFVGNIEIFEQHFRKAKSLIIQ